MEEQILLKITDRCLDDRSIDMYVKLAGRKATKTDCRALAANVIPFLVTQLDSKASKDTKTADKLHEYMMQAHDPASCEDPKFGSAILTALMGNKKMEIVAFNADELLVHPFVIENMLIAMAPAVMRSYAAEFGRDVFHRIIRGPGPQTPPPPQPRGGRVPEGPVGPIGFGGPGTRGGRR